MSNQIHFNKDGTIELEVHVNGYRHAQLRISYAAPLHRPSWVTDLEWAGIKDEIEQYDRKMEAWGE